MGQKDSTPSYGAVATRVVVTVIALWLAGIGTFKVLFATPDQAAGPAVAVAIGGLALGLAGAWRSRRRGQSTILAVATAVALIGGTAAGSTGGFLAVQQDHEKAERIAKSQQEHAEEQREIRESRSSPSPSRSHSSNSSSAASGGSSASGDDAAFVRLVRAGVPTMSTAPESSILPLAEASCEALDQLQPTSAQDVVDLAAQFHAIDPTGPSDVDYLAIFSAAVTTHCREWRDITG